MSWFWSFLTRARTQKRKAPRRRGFVPCLTLEDLEARIVPTNDSFLVPGTTSTQVSVSFIWTMRDAGFNNELGVYKVDDADGRVNGLLPTDPGYPAAAIARGQKVFASGAGAGTSTELSFAGASELGFYLIQNANTDQWRNNNPTNNIGHGPLAFFSFDGANPDHFHHDIMSLAGAVTRFAWEDGTFGGDQDFNDLVMTVGVSPVRVLTQGSTPTTFTFNDRQSAFHNEVGVYKVDDVAGTVGNLHPGDPGYAAAALQASRRQTLFTGNESSGTKATVNFPAGTLFAMYLVQNGSSDSFLASNPTNDPGKSPQAFFSLFQANPDHLDHLQASPGNVLGWEDQTGGGDFDYNDTLVTFSSGTTTTPTGPTSTATPTFDLAASSDSGTVGDHLTDQPAVTLVGTASPNVTLTLAPGGATTTSDANGNFSFTGVNLAPGANTFQVTAKDAAGNTATGSQTITLNRAPTVSQPVSDVTVAQDAADTVLNLTSNFTDPDVGNSVVHLDTSAGPIDMQLLDQDAPLTVANFLQYVTSGAYNSSIFHRSVPGFVLQGGGFTFQTSPSRLTTIPTNAPVQNEFGRSNVRGTVAMAKLGNDPNSATDQFFFNLADNSSNLDTQNGGFTVFATLSGASLNTVDALAAIPTKDESTAPALPASEQGVFNQIPLQNYNGTNFPTDTTAANYALINSATVTSRSDVLTFSVVSNSNAALVTPTVTGNALTLHYAAGQTGTSTIVVRATDRFGATVDTSFTVTVGGAGGT